MTESTQASVFHTTKGPAYKDILAEYKGDMERVEKAIHDNFQSDVAMIPAVSGYLIGGGGKRIRPLLLIASARLCGYTGSSRHIKHSVVVEYIHAATLLHDDVVDEADTRRGSASANIKYGNEASVLVGDFLFAKSFQLMSEDNDIRIIQAVSNATKNLAEGEVLQLANTCDLDTTEDIYMDTIYRKTGALMEACLRIGAILGGVDKEKEEALAEYGRNIGIAFQMVDDVLDYVGEEKEWGKPLGADLSEGKITLPLIRALKLADEGEKKIIREIVESDQSLESGFETALGVLNKYNTLSHTMDLAREHIEEAKLKLSCFERSSHFNALVSLADYIAERTV